MSVRLTMRLLGMAVFGIVGWQVGELLARTAPPEEHNRYVVTAMGLGLSVGGLIAPLLTLRPARYFRSKIRQLPAQELIAIAIGLIVGLIVAALLTPVLVRLPPPLGEVLPFVAALVFGYLGVAVVTLRRTDLLGPLGKRLTGSEDEGEEDRPVLLDTSVIIDGRIADISQTGFIPGPMLVPRFVLNELQRIADSPDTLRRNRGRRGLELLNRLRSEAPASVRITDAEVPEAREVDDKLIVLAKRLHCPIVTNDYNLNRVAQVQGVTVLNINELANAVKSVLLPGETITVKVIQEGKEFGQGVAYLEDGTMIVIEDGRPLIGQTVPVLVKKVLQKMEGRLVFAQSETER